MYKQLSLRNKLASLILLFQFFFQNCNGYCFQFFKPKLDKPYDEEAPPSANSNSFPRQILKTNVVLNSKTISANSQQLSDQLNLTPIIKKINSLNDSLNKTTPKSLDYISIKQDILEAKQNAVMIIDKTNLEIDFVLAEIKAETNLYNEILNTFIAERDKMVARSNAYSFYSNGALWAIGEALDIPTNVHPNLSIPSGILGIVAGLVPSAFSLYAMHQYNGKARTSECEPNMLAKIFNYKINNSIEYPDSVINYLNSKPADHNARLTRKDIIINRWISDSNLSNFTDKDSKKELNVVTASVATKKGLTIANLQTRVGMLDQLYCEIFKMKRLLLDLQMLVNQDKILLN